MEFCEVCDNMLYLSNREDDQELVHVCKKCGYEHTRSDETTLISSMTFSKQEQYTSVINKYTKLDPTLPRIQNIPCPQEDCPNHKVGRDIIYVRYDNVDLKYAYLCPLCDTVWKTDKN